VLVVVVVVVVVVVLWLLWLPVGAVLTAAAGLFF